MDTTRTDESFLYQKEQDGWLVTIHGDFAEMLHIDAARNTSLYEVYEAPIDKIRAAIKDLKTQGYTLVYSLNLNLKSLIES